MEPRNLIALCPSLVTSTLITSIFFIIRVLTQLAGELGLAPHQPFNYITLYTVYEIPTGSMGRTRKSSSFTGDWFLLHLQCC